jgi:hypothetical protein
VPIDFTREDEQRILHQPALRFQGGREWNGHGRRRHCTAGYAGDGGPAAAARLNTPNGGKNLGRAVYHRCAAADGCALTGATRSRVLLKMALGLWCVQRVATDVVDWDLNKYAATGK